MSARLPFNPGINPVVLADLPGLPSGATGSRVNEWLGSAVIGQRMGIGPDGPLVLDSLVAQRDPAGLDLADDLGRVLGGLVGTLVLGTADARAGRPDWPAAQWDSWSLVRRVAVGGGIVTGVLGERMVGAARDWLAETAVPVDVLLARDPGSLVLRGATVGGVPGGGPDGVVLDCGGTTIKRAVAIAGVVSLRPGAPAPGPGRAAYEVVETLARAALEIAPPGEQPLGVAVAVATYVDGTGQPYAGQLGPYACLGDVDLVADLTRVLSERLGRRVTVRVRHDGAAALLGARLDDPATDAVIVLGTAVGHALAPVRRRRP